MSDRFVTPLARRTTVGSLPSRPTSPRPALAELLTRPVRTHWTYALSRVDASGRVAEKRVVGALDWAAGDRLTVTAEGTSVIILRRDSRGPDTLISKERVRLPISLRIRCGIQVGDRVLLAATRELDLLLAYPLSTVEQALSAFHKAAAEVEL